ncbi:MAG: GtrA family protein [Clostridia bacterium]|nr:GtrA family protein [Clostridia bacterium]
MKMIKKLITEYREQIVYIFFGVLTTAVNLVVFHLFERVLGENRYLVSNIIAWLCSVAFAYVTNKIWVFKSKGWNKKILLKEIPAFVSARVFSFVIEELGLYLLVDCLSMKAFSINVFGFEVYGSMIAKVVLAVVVVILNYVFSKFIVFGKREV